MATHIETSSAGQAKDFASLFRLNGMLLRPIPYLEPDRLSMIFEAIPREAGPSSVSFRRTLSIGVRGINSSTIWPW